METHKDLRVWQQSIEMVTSIYLMTQSFPKEEIFGLTSQLRRASVSVPSNIAEGQQRSTTKDFLHFLCIAKGSTAELITQLEITKELYPELNELIDSLLNEYIILSKQLANLIKSIKYKVNNSNHKKSSR